MSAIRDLIADGEHDPIGKRRIECRHDTPRRIPYVLHATETSARGLVAFECSQCAFDLMIVAFAVQ